jgi:hypothetical protein
MKLSRRNILRARLYSPLAALGLWNKPSSAALSRPMITVPVCCAYCAHYTPPQSLIMLDGPPSGYCGHPYYRNGHYLYDGAIDKYQLHRKPDDRCGRFSIRKDRDPGIMHDMPELVFSRGINDK